METINKIVSALNGNKTNIGAAVLFVATFFTAVIVGIWHVQGDWVQPTIDTLNWVGMAITGVGLGHKAIKSQTADTPAQ